MKKKLIDLKKTDIDVYFSDMVDANLAYQEATAEKRRWCSATKFSATSSSQRIIYPDGTSYPRPREVSPFEMDSPPEDAMKFMEYLEEIGVPKLAIVKKKD